MVSHESGNDSASSLTISEYEHDSSLSEMDEEDEVFFGPMSKAELKRLHDARNIHRRSTEMLTLTPLCEDDNDAGEGDHCGNQDTISATLKVPLALQVPVQCATPEPSPMGGVGGVVRIPKSGGEEGVKTEAAAMLIQSHFRRMLAKEAFNRRRNDLRFLAMKGSISVPLPALPIGRNRDMAADGLGDWQDVAPLRSAAITTTTNTANMMREKNKPPIPSIPPVPQSAGIVSSPLRRGLSIRNWFHRQPA
ncbi:hypothetical protein GGH99_002693, partial [Coemansia sp. RSA 1285]